MCVCTGSALDLTISQFLPKLGLKHLQEIFDREQVRPELFFYYHFVFLLLFQIHYLMMNLYKAATVELY